MKPFGSYRSFGHWLSYNWGWVLLAVLLVLVLLYTRLVQTGGPPPDYLVSWVGVSALSEEEEQAVRASLERLGRDENGDGQVLVQVSQFIVDFSVDTSDSRFETNYSYVMRLMAELQTGECYLFLLDQPERFQYATGALQYLDGRVPADTEGGGYESENWEQMCVPFRADGFPRAAWLARRSLFGDQSAEELFPGADGLFEAAAGLS